MPIAKTYTICLCDHGKEFRRIPNVVDDERGSRPKTGDVIDQKWLVIGVRSQTATEIVVDVEEVARPAN